MRIAIRFICAASALWLSAGMAPGAQAANECPPLAIVAQVDLVPADDNTAFLVPVEIAGVTKLMLLDTGSARTIITSKAAAELHLEERRSNVRLYSMTGRYSDYRVTAPIGIGALKGGTFDFQLAPDPLIRDDPNIAGLLGADVLGQFDISIDFPKRKLDIISQNHCDGRVVYWKERPLAVIPFKRLHSGHIVLPVGLDGRTIKAIFDTGASRSTLNQTVAQNAFGVQLGSQDTPAAGTFNGEEGSTVWRHIFKTLTFEGVTVANPMFTIVPERTRKHVSSTELGSLIPKTDEQLEPDVLLGMNVLRYLHVYVAYKEEKLYITPSDAPH